MSLPQVTPGTYDYGAYAAPQQVKVDTQGIKDIGEAVGKGVSSILKEIATNVERKNELKKSVGEFNAYTADSFAGDNEKAVYEFSEAYSEWIKDSNKLFRKDKEEYYRKKAFWENNMNNIKALKDISMKGMPDVDLGDVKTEDFEQYLYATQVANGSYLLEFDPEKGFNVNLSNIEIESFPKIYGEDAQFKSKDGQYIPGSKEFSVSPVSQNKVVLSDFLNRSDSYIGFNMKFKETDEGYINELNTKATVLDKKQMTAYTTQTANNREYLDVDAAIEGIKDSAYVKELVGKYGKLFNTDVFEKEKTEDELRLFFASNLVERATFVGDKIPDKSPSYADVTARIKANAEWVRANREQQESVTKANWRTTKVAAAEALDSMKTIPWFVDLTQLVTSQTIEPSAGTELYRLLRKGNYTVKKPIYGDNEKIEGYIIKPIAGFPGGEESLILGKGEADLRSTLETIFQTNIRNANTFLNIPSGSSSGSGDNFLDEIK